MKDYYVYALIDPRTNLPFYIGKGKNDRMLQHLKEGATNGVKKHNKILEIRAAGFEPLTIKLAEGMAEDEAYHFEENLITKLGREGIDKNGILTNNKLRAYSPVMTKEVRQAISTWRTGMTFTDDHRQNLSKAKKRQNIRRNLWARRSKKTSRSTI